MVFKIRNGFTLLEVMLVVAIMTLLGAMSIPSLLRARISTNESAAQAALKTIATAEYTYRIVNANYTDLAQLGNATPPYIDRALADGVKNGYNFTSAGGVTIFVATAVARSNSTGIRRFCITEDGVIRVNSSITGSTDHDTCQGYGAAVR